MLQKETQLAKADMGFIQNAFKPKYLVMDPVWTVFLGFLKEKRGTELLV